VSPENLFLQKANETRPPLLQTKARQTGVSVRVTRLAQISHYGKNFTKSDLDDDFN
jgi:hypothetical protein